MREVELKAKLTDISPVDLAQQLTEQGFAFGGVAKQEDVYYGGTALHHQVLRLRTSRDLLAGNTRCYLTYKGTRDRSIQSREEIQTVVEDGEATGLLLKCLGFTPLLTVKKTRRHYHSGPVTVCLDAVEGLGPFVELEILVAQDSQQQEALERLMVLLKEIGLDQKHLIHHSYWELLFKKDGQN